MNKSYHTNSIIGMEFQDKFNEEPVILAIRLCIFSSHSLLINSLYSSVTVPRVMFINDSEHLMKYSKWNYLFQYQPYAQ